jgi:hypothetical protein
MVGELRKVGGEGKRREGRKMIGKGMKVGCSRERKKKVRM